MKKMAILLSGGVNYINDYPRYGNDLGFAYTVLTENCNYDSNNMDVLYSFGKDIIYQGTTIKTHIASHKNLEAALAKAANQLEDEDEFILVVSNHGSDINEGLINLWNQEEIFFDSLAELLKHIKAKKVIVLGECYAGNFIRDDIPNCCILAGNEKDKKTFVNPHNHNYDEFLFNFFSFLYGKFPDSGTLIDSSVVDIEKAFIFARENDAFNPNNPNYCSRYNSPNHDIVEIPQMFNNIIDLHSMLK